MKTESPPAFQINFCSLLKFDKKTARRIRTPLDDSRPFCLGRGLCPILAGTFEAAQSHSKLSRHAITGKQPHTAASVHRRSFADRLVTAKVTTPYNHGCQAFWVLENIESAFRFLDNFFFFSENGKRCINIPTKSTTCCMRQSTSRPRSVDGRTMCLKGGESQMESDLYALRSGAPSDHHIVQPRQHPSSPTRHGQRVVALAVRDHNE
ncbi:hypothetical protein NHJ13734_002844 [Beauveria thailandica]